MDKARPLANYHFYLRLRIWCSNNTGVPGSLYFGRKCSNNYTCIILFQHSLSCAACYMTSGQNEFTDNCVLNFLIIMFMIVSIKVTIILKYDTTFTHYSFICFATWFKLFTLQGIVLGSNFLCYFVFYCFLSRILLQVLVFPFIPLLV